MIVVERLLGFRFLFGPSHPDNRGLTVLEIVHTITGNDGSGAVLNSVNGV